MTAKDNPAAEAIRAALISPNEMDSNMEAANVVDGLFAIARAIHHLAEAVESTRDSISRQFSGISGQIQYAGKGEP